MMRPLGLILSLAPLAVVADVQFTSPSAGASVPAGTINLQWKDNGIAPAIADLTAYTLVLMVGGNDDADMLPLTTFVSQGTFASGNDASGTIPSGIAGACPNGFFFKIESSSASGGIVINYSDRFTITGLTGATDQQYRDAVTALKGSTKGPPSVGDSSSSSSSTAVLSSTATGLASPTSPTSMVTVTQSPSTTSTPHKGGAGTNQHSGGLSSGALVGIAIAGVAVGLLGLGVALWMCLRRKRRRDQGMVKLDDNSDLSAEVFRKEMSLTTPPVELDPYSRIVEADTGTPPAELPSTNIRAELAGDFVHGQDKGRPDSMLTEVPQTPISPMTIGTGTMDTGTWNSMRFGHSELNLTPETPGTPVTPRDNV